MGLIVAWVWWLLAPLLVTALACLLTWVAGRPRRPVTSEQSVRRHQSFLATLAEPPARADGRESRTGAHAHLDGRGR